MAAVAALCRAQDLALQRDREKEGRERDKRFEIKREVPKVASTEGEALLKEFTDFEARIHELGVVSARQMYQLFELALQGAAKEWLEFERSTNLAVKEAYRRASSSGANEADFGEYFRLARGVLMIRAGFEDENPGESAVVKWEALPFPESVRCFEDLNDWLTTVTSHYNNLVRMGQHQPGRVLDENKLLTDLHRKVPKGTDFHRWFYGQ